MSKRATVVAIEDEAGILEEILDFLELAGFDGYGAGNGHDGLELIWEHKPDIILCDIMMPVMDGYEVLAEVRRRSDTAVIPFIFLTAKAQMDDLRHGMTLGADDYITKPFVFPDLEKAIESRLMRQQQQELEFYRSLAHRLVDIQEKEKERLAQKLNSDLLMLLASAKLTLSVSRGLTGVQYESASEDIGRMLDEAMANVEKLTSSLHPEMISRLGLLHMIMWQIESFREWSSVPVVVIPTNLTMTATTQFKLLIFRILAELLENGSKHANAGQLQVTFQQTDDELLLTYEDDGVGFDLATVYGRGVGLVLLDEYVRALSGTMHILSAVGQGTHVSIQFPLEGSLEGGFENALLGQKLDANATSLSASELQALPSKPVLATAILCSNTVFQAGLEQMLQSYKAFEINVIAELSAIEVLEQSLIPLDLLLVDSSILTPSVLAQLERVILEQTHLRILVVANPYTLSYIAYLANFGLQGVVGYNASLAQYAEAITALVSGRPYIADPLSLEQVERYRSQLSHPHDKNLSLTPREIETLKLLLEGLRSKEIAQKLVVSPRTIEVHRMNIMRKLGAKSVVELARIALERGY